MQETNRKFNCLENTADTHLHDNGNHYAKCSITRSLTPNPLIIDVKNNQREIIPSILQDYYNQKQNLANMKIQLESRYEQQLKTLQNKCQILQDENAQLQDKISQFFFKQHLLSKEQSICCYRLGSLESQNQDNSLSKQPITSRDYTEYATDKRQKYQEQVYHDFMNNFQQNIYCQNQALSHSKSAKIYDYQISPKANQYQCQNSTNQNQQINSSSRINTKQNQQLIEYQQENNRIQELSTQNEDLIKKLDQANQELLNKENHISNLQKQLTDQKKTYEQNLEKLNFQISKLQQQTQTNNQNKILLNTNSATTKDKSHRNQQEMSDLKSDLHQLQQALQNKDQEINFLNQKFSNICKQYNITQTNSQTISQNQNNTKSNDLIEEKVNKVVKIVPITPQQLEKTSGSPNAQRSIIQKKGIQNNQQSPIPGSQSYREQYYNEKNDGQQDKNQEKINQILFIIEQQKLEIQQICKIKSEKEEEVQQLKNQSQQIQDQIGIFILKDNDLDVCLHLMKINYQQNNQQINSKGIQSQSSQEQQYQQQKREIQEKIQQLKQQLDQINEEIQIKSEYSELIKQQHNQAIIDNQRQQSELKYWQSQYSTQINIKDQGIQLNDNEQKKDHKQQINNQNICNTIKKGEPNNIYQLQQTSKVTEDLKIINDNKRQKLDQVEQNYQQQESNKNVVRELKQIDLQRRQQLQEQQQMYEHKTQILRDHIESLKEFANQNMQINKKYVQDVADKIKSFNQQCSPNKDAAKKILTM